MPVASTGDLLGDLGLALAVIVGDRAANVWMILPRAAVNPAATSRTAEGLQRYPSIAADGGRIANVKILPSHDLPEDSSGPMGLVINADGLALGDEPIQFRTSTVADLVMDSDPAEGAQNVSSLFQTNAIGLFIERKIGARRLRDNAVYAISAPSYEAVT